VGAVAYRELAAPAGLSPWVECAWQVAEGAGGTGAAAEHRVLPDGCIDLIFREREGLQVAGPDTRAFVATIPAGGSAVGVRMRPGGAPALLGLPAAALRDSRTPAGDVLGPAAAPLAEAVAETAGPEARARLLLAWLAGRARGAAPPDPLVAAAAQGLGARPDLRVAGLARELGLGERHLRRRFVEGVGYGPKLLARVLRLQRALAMARADPGLGWSAVAFRAGYADQAHLANDCRALAGVPPTALAAGR
jgi:AraC-like DNA-binding protein